MSICVLFLKKNTLKEMIGDLKQSKQDMSNVRTELEGLKESLDDDSYPSL